MTTLRKIFVITICILTVASFIPKNCFGLVKDWGRKWGSGVNYAGAYSVSIDSNDNSYVTGKTYWHFDGQTNYGVYNIFLTKHNSSGVKQWTRIWGPTDAAKSQAAVGYDVSIDSASNCYVTGETSGPFDGQGEENSYNVFLTKYNSAGTKLWTRIWGSTNEYDTGRSVSIAPDGNCYVAGDTGGEFDGQTNDGSAHTFLTKYSSSGTKVWTRICLTNGIELAYATSASAHGIYITGYTKNKFNNENWDFFLRKFSSSGDEQWTRFWGSETFDYGEGVAVDSAGNCYVAGHTFGEFDGQTNAGSYDNCLTKFSSSGTKLWTRIWGSTALEYCKDVAVDALGNAYVTGWTGGDFDGQINNGPYDCFLTKYSPSGTKIWTKIWGASGSDYTDGVSVNSSGSVCYAAGYTDSVIIDGYTNTTGNIYLRKFVASVPPSETFSSANSLASDAGIADGSNIGATIESGEPAHAGNGGPYHSVWWNWSEPISALRARAAAGDTLLIDTHGSDFDTVLAIYTGSAVNNLTQIAANDNAGTGIETSELSFQFNPGVIYHIAVDGKTSSDTGNVILNYAIIPEGGITLLTLAASFIVIRLRHSR